MSIFQKQGENPSDPAPGAAPSPSRAPAAQGGGVTQVAPGAKFRGEITGTSDLVIGGEVDGKLMVQGMVTVESSGMVKGEIDARKIKVGGHVKGNIAGSESIEILGQGSVKGDVKSPRVVIADGAFFKGKVEMGSDSS